MNDRPWCCPEPRCTPIHQLRGGDAPLSMPEPGESFVCFGVAPPIRFEYDGVEHINDTRSCSYTPLKGLIAWQENAGDWRALGGAYSRAADLRAAAATDRPTAKPLESGTFPAAGPAAATEGEQG